MNLKLETVVIEIKGDDINRLYEAFLDEDSFKLFMAGYVTWDALLNITKAVTALYTNLETIGYNMDFMSFRSESDIKAEELAEFLTEHVQILGSHAALTEYVTKHKL